MDKKLKILIITHYFPPLNSIASHRPYSWAKYWTRAGHEITVLTTKKEKRDNDLNLDCNQFRVIEIENIVLNKLRKLKSLLNYPSESNISKLRKVADEVNLKSKIIKRVREFFDSRGILTFDQRCPNLHDFWFKSALKTVQFRNYDVVVSTFAPYVTHIIAYKLKKQNNNIFWIADYRDLWTQSHLFRGLFPFTLIDEYLEKKINKTADVITTVSEPLARQIKDKYDLENVEVIENGFDVEDLEMIPKDKYWNDDKVRLIYTGTIYEDKRDPSPLFKAIQNISKSDKKDLLNKLEVLFVGSYSDILEKLVKKYNVSKWVSYGGFVPREDTIRMQRDAHALIFLEFEAPGVDGILTGKLFEYLYSETLILGIGVTDKSAPGKLIKDSGHGINFGRDSEKLANFLIELLKSGAKPVIRKNEEFLKKYSREIQALKMLNLVKKYGK